MVAALMASAVCGQSLVPAPGSGGFRESLDTSRPVSAASLLIGLTVVDAANASKRSLPRDRLWLRCLSGCSGAFQIEATGATGRYTGSGRVDGAATAGQWVEIPIGKAPTAVARARQQLAADQLASIAWSLDDRGARRGDRPIMVAWSAGHLPPSGDTLLVAVGGDADMAVSTGKGPLIPCRPTSARAPTSFTLVCAVPLSAIGADGRLELVRREGTAVRRYPLRLM